MEEEEEQHPINQRIKFLVETLGLNVHRFATLLGVKDGSVRNYLDRNSKPGADFLTLLLDKIPDLSAEWLLRGEGNTFRKDNASAAANTLTQNIKNNKGNVQNNTGSHNTINNVKLEDCQRDLATAQKEIGLLTSQLADKERTIQILLKQNS